MPCKWNDLTRSLVRSLRGDLLSRVKKTTFCVSLYFLWKCRNEVLFRKSSLNQEDLVKSIMFMLKIKFSSICKVPNRPNVVRWCRMLKLDVKVLDS